MNDEEGDEQIQDTAVDIDLDRDESEEEEVKKGYVYRCLKKSGCSYVANLPSRWPRTCGVLLGVVRQICAWLPLIYDHSQFTASLEGIANYLFSCFRLFHFFP